MAVPENEGTLNEQMTVPDDAVNYGNPERRLTLV